MLEKYALFKVIGSLLKADNELSLREIARRSGVGPGTAKISLEYLHQNQIATQKILGNLHLFRLNPENFLARQLKIFSSLMEINSSDLVQEILSQQEMAGIISISLYGSVAKGNDDSHSDIDLLVISRKKTKTIFIKSKTTREINCLNYTYSEWKDKAEKDPVFYKEVILNCIPLYGEKPVVL